MIFWLPQFYGSLQLSTVFVPVDWHIHELFFGFLATVITGFLFTAIPNWTGRLPVRGNPLLFLVILWFSGRLAVTFSAYIGWILAMLIDLSFLTAIALLIGNEVISGKNWRNLKVLLPLAMLWLANICFHLEAHFYGVSDISRRLAMAATITLIMMIGGRIIPSFTRNWLVRENPGRLPMPFNRFDVLSIIVSVLAFGAWIFYSESPLVGILMALAAGLQIVRLGRWAGHRTVGDLLVTMLHISYFFIPLGFFLVALSEFWPDTFPAVSGMHAFGVGAIGSMTLSVMIRATLGHTGQALKAGIGTKLIFCGIITAAISRIGAEFYGIHADILLQIAAFAWFFAFLGFSVGFAPLLLQQKTRVSGSS